MQPWQTKHSKTVRTFYGTYCTVKCANQFRDTKDLGSTSIRQWSNPKVLNRYLIDIDPRVFTSIGNLIVEIRRSYDRLISTMWFPILVRRHFILNQGPVSWYVAWILFLGWGKTSSTSDLAEVLQEAEVEVYTNAECKSRWGTKIGPYHICVGRLGESGACNGDSGGPLVCNMGSNWRLAGVTSWGRPDCSVLYPSVYTRVSHFRDWINDVTNFWGQNTLWRIPLKSTRTTPFMKCNLDNLTKRKPMYGSYGFHLHVHLNKFHLSYCLQDCHAHTWNRNAMNSNADTSVIQSAGDLVSETLCSNPAFSRGRQLVSFRFSIRISLACAIYIYDPDIL